MNCCGEMVSFTRSVADLLCESFMLAKERAGNNFLISSWRFGAGLQSPPSPGP